MTQTKKDIYRKAYSELNEIFNSALSFEVEKIPSNVLENMRSQMDTEYNWSYDYSKNLMDQDMMSETKALLVEFYARFLCPNEEKERWERYNNICAELIEEERIKQYEQNQIFCKADENTSEEVVENVSEIEVKEITTSTELTSKEENILSKIVNFIKNLGNIFKK